MDDARYPRHAPPAARCAASPDEHALGAAVAAATQRFPLCAAELPTTCTSQLAAPSCQRHPLHRIATTQPSAPRRVPSRIQLSSSLCSMAQRGQQLGRSRRSSRRSAIHAGDRRARSASSSRRLRLPSSRWLPSRPPATPALLTAAASPGRPHRLPPLRRNYAVTPPQPTPRRPPYSAATPRQARSRRGGVRRWRSQPTRHRPPRSAAATAARSLDASASSVAASPAA